MTITAREIHHSQGEFAVATAKKQGELLDLVREELGEVSEYGATMELSRDEEPSGCVTVIVKFQDGSDFRMYSSTSPASLRAYTTGLLHALKLVNGSYAFKPDNEQAERRRRMPATPWKEESRLYRMHKIAEKSTRMGQDSREGDNPDNEPVSFKAAVLREARAQKSTSPKELSPRLRLWGTRFRG